MNPLGVLSEWGSVSVGVSPSFLMDFAKCLIKFNVAINNFFEYSIYL